MGIQQTRHSPNIKPQLGIPLLKTLESLNMENPSSIRIVVKSNDDDKEKVVVSTLVEEAEQIIIRFYLKSPDGTDKVLTELIIKDTCILVRMEDKLENSLCEGNFYIRNGQLIRKLKRPGYKE